MPEFTPLRELLSQLSDWFFKGVDGYEPWNEDEARPLFAAWLQVHDQTRDAEIERLNRRLYPGQGEDYANEVERLRSVTEELQRIAGELQAENELLRALLRDVVVAASRMRDDWAEGDEGRKRDLWRGLHTAADAAEDDVYPLASERELTPEQRQRFEAVADRALARRRARLIAESPAFQAEVKADG